MVVYLNRTIRDNSTNSARKSSL